MKHEGNLSILGNLLARSRGVTRRETLLLFFLTLCWSAFLGVSWAGQVVNDFLVTAPFSHHLWQAVLSENVDPQGRVDFYRLRAQPKTLNAYLAQLALASPESHPDLFQSNDERLAYWINAYNALALRMVLTRYPTERIGDMRAFRHSRIHRLGGVAFSLRALEKEITDQYYWKPGVVFALSDLTRSAPPLLNQAYRGDVLNRQLQRRAEEFMQSPGTIKVPVGCEAVQLSPVLKQFQAPLLRYVQEVRKVSATTTTEVLLQSVQPYLTPEDQGRLAQECSRKVAFQPFDHRLRLQENPVGNKTP